MLCGLSTSWPIGCDTIQPSFSKSLNHILDFTWLVTNEKRNSLYEISLCSPSNLCSSARSNPTSICRIENNSSAKNEPSSSILGYQTSFQLKNTSDGYLLKIKGAKCDKKILDTQLNHMTYIYFTCGKTLGHPVLVIEDEINKDEDEEHLFDENEDKNVCKTVFTWSTNQVCADKRFSKYSEMPCYLTLNDKGSANDLYMSVDFSSLIKTESSSLNDRSNFYQVVEFNDEMEISLDLCRYGSLSKIKLT